MADTEKISVRLNPCEMYYLRRYAAMHDRSLTDMIRRCIHDYIIAHDGESAAINLLRGRPPK